MANSGYPTKTTTIRLPRGGYLGAPILAGSGPYGAHDPYLRGANPYAGGAGQAGALTGGGGRGGAYVAGGGAAGLAAQYQAAQNRAADANAALEDELKTGYADRLKRNMDAVGTLSDQSLVDTNRIFDERGNRLRRQFNGGGSANQSTVMASVLSQNEGARSEALNRARDALTMRRVALDADLSGDALRQREAVTNAYPDYNQLARLSEGMGEANAPTAPMPTQQQPVPPVQPSVDVPRPAMSLKDAMRLNSYEATRRKKLDARARMAWSSTPTTPVGGATSAVAAAPIPQHQLPTGAGVSHSYSPATGFTPAPTWPQTKIYSGPMSDRVKQATQAETRFYLTPSSSFGLYGDAKRKMLRS